MDKLTIRDIDFKGKKVFIRVDFNVPQDEQGNITDDTRIRSALPTLNYVLEKGAKKLIIASHLGRPKGVDPKFKMDPVARALAKLLKKKVVKLADCVGEPIQKAIDGSADQIFLLENLRFHPEEEKGDEDFAKQLAELADVYVNDAFGTSHRAHASVCGIAGYLKSAAGFLMEKEIDFLSKVTYNPQKPFAAILGGAKVSDKIDVIEHLLDKVDGLLIGGAMAYTFLKAKGEKVGSSRVENDKVEVAKNILDKAVQKKVEVVLPCDHLVVKAIDDPSSKKIVKAIPEGFLGVDIGPESVNLFKKALARAKTVLWNGPLGIFENEAYAQGTKVVAEYLTTLKAVVVVGGGDTAAAANKFKVAAKLSHVSTGGGASLEFMEGKPLPGVEALSDK
jgi:3-phosphoglycerate kinase